MLLFIFKMLFKSRKDNLLILSKPYWNIVYKEPFQRMLISFIFLPPWSHRNTAKALDMLALRSHVSTWK